MTIIDTQRIEKAIYDRTLSAREVAQKINVSERTAAAYRRGESSIKKMSLQKAIEITEILDKQQLGSTSLVSEATTGYHFILDFGASLLYQSKKCRNNFVEIYKDHKQNPRYYSFADYQTNTVVLIIQGIQEAREAGKDTSDMYFLLQERYFIKKNEDRHGKS